MSKINITVFVSFILLLQACNTKYEKSGWLEEADVEQYPKRNAMLEDLLTNYKLKGLSYKQLTDLIGEPAKNWSGEKGEIFYPIITEYGSEIDPVYSKTLTFKLNSDSIVTDFKVEEWKK